MESKFTNTANKIINTQPITSPQYLFKYIETKILNKYKHRDSQLIQDFEEIVDYILNIIQTSTLMDSVKQYYVSQLNTILKNADVPRLLVFIAQEAKGI